MILQEQLNDCFLSRSEPRECMSSSEREEYEALYKKYHDIYDSIQSMLTADGKDILFELDSLIGEIQNLAAECSYKQGIKDGLELAKGVSILGSNLQLTPRVLKRVK